MKVNSDINIVSIEAKPKTVETDASWVAPNPTVQKYVDLFEHQQIEVDLSSEGHIVSTAVFERMIDAVKSNSDTHFVEFVQECLLADSNLHFTLQNDAWSSMTKELGILFGGGDAKGLASFNRVMTWLEDHGAPKSLVFLANQAFEQGIDSKEAEALRAAGTNRQAGFVLDNSTGSEGSGISTPVAEISTDETPPASSFAIGEVVATAKASDLVLMQKINNIMAVKLYNAYKNAGTNPIVAPVLTLKQICQLFTSFRHEESKKNFKKMYGLSHVADDQIMNAVTAYAQTLLKDLPAGIELNLADTVLLAENITFKDDLANHVEQAGGSVHLVDFKNPHTVHLLNAWVDQKTNGKIKDIVSENAFDDSVHFALASTINIDAHWKNPFPGYDETFDADFRLENGETVEVKMMQSEDHSYRVLSNEEYDVVCVPNGDSGDFASIYIKPKSGTVDECIESLGPDGLNDLIYRVRNARSTVGAIQLPRAKAEFNPASSISKQAVMNCGLSTELNVRLDGQKVFISDVIYKAVTEKDEKKNSAAAAQLMIGRSIGGTARQPAKVLFKGDRPMVELIVRGDSILFLNGLKNPLGDAAESVAQENRSSRSHSRSPTRGG